MASPLAAFGAEYGAKKGIEASPEAATKSPLATFGAEYGAMKANSEAAPEGATKLVENTKEKKSSGAPVYLGALDFMRFFAAVHILGFHNQSHLHGHEAFFRWGDTWVPYFFILSAFVTSFAQLNRKDPTNVGEFLPFLKKRLVGVYPSFFFAMILSIAVRVYIPYMTLELNAADFILNVLLLQTWRPWVTHQTLNVNLPSWFVSALVFQWVVWFFAFPKMSQFSVRSVLAVMALTACTTYFKANTLYEHSYGPAEFPNKYNPFMNVDFCVYGMCLAVLFKHWVDKNPNAKDILGITLGGQRFAFSGMIGFFGLMALFWMVDAKESAKFHWNCNLGYLVPLQMLLIWGLASGEGPVAWLSNQKPFCWGGQVSYPLYILQGPITLMAIYEFREMFGDKYWIHCELHETLPFFWKWVFPVNLAFAIFATFCVEKPIQKRL